MEQLNLIALAVPVFFAAILVEAVVARVRRQERYRLGCAVADLDAGIASQVADLFLKGLGLWAYAWVYRYRLITLPQGSALPWVIGIVGIDFLYYWWHRVSHVTNFFWAVHAVHHQSEDMNLAVALRQPAFEALTIIPFHVPLALLGVPPAVYVSCYAIDLIFQFWVHTELTRRQSTLEWVLNTPSAHRVHHGVNPRYIDRNYGGIFLLWDRIFGTYEPEREPPVYGVAHPLASYNPVWANFAPWFDVARLFREAPAGEKVAVFFAHPGRHSPEQRRAPLPIARESWKKYDPRPPRAVAAYVLAHFVILALVGGAFLSQSEGLKLVQLVIPGAWILGSTIALAAWSEGRPWARGFDFARQAAAVVIAFALAFSRLGGGVAAAIAAALAAVFAAVYAFLRPTPSLACS